VDLAEGILDVVGLVEIVFWPVAMDFKRQEIEARDDGSIRVSFINGGIRTDEQAEMVRLLRRKSRLVVAYGACAHLGGIPALANTGTLRQLLQGVYRDTPSTTNPGGEIPRAAPAVNGRSLHLPPLRERLARLEDLIPVDYTLPGCPPTPELLFAAVQALLSATPPPAGAVLAPNHALCEECHLRDTKPSDLRIRAFHRPHMVAIDPAACLLAQGIVCMGPATRAGCGARCVTGAMPCTGCFGPTDRVRDQGAKMLSAVAAAAAGDTPEEIDAVLDGIPDPLGTFYRYGTGLLPGPHS
jgi:F420-non-reducing hydrogenase small subunit